MNLSQFFQIKLLKNYNKYLLLKFSSLHQALKTSFLILSQSDNQMTCQARILIQFSHSTPAK